MLPSTMNSRPTLIVFYGLSGPTLTFIKIAGCERSFQVTVATASASILHGANDNDTLQLRAHATLTVQSPTRATTSTVPPRAST